MTNQHIKNEIITEIQRSRENLSLRILVDDLIARFDAETLFDTIVEYMKQPTLETGEWVTCIRTLCRIDKIRANEIFIQVLENETDTERRARVILNLCGVEIIVPTLIKILQEDPNPDIRFIVIRELGDIGDKRALSALHWTVEHDQAVNYEDQPLSSLAEWAIDKLNDSEDK